ncbi:hypothetical protein [Dubosiella newyorkensis]|uniref:hypothetical protein n=1 Tax=Dubosiella newyorkensis TaxID=1862672 RepID=UPI003F6725E7
MMDFSTLRFWKTKRTSCFWEQRRRKNHMAVSLGIEAAKKRNSTYFIKCHDLISS